MTDRHEAEGHGKGKVAKCFIDSYGDSYRHQVFPTDTPAFAITEQAYNEVRRHLETIARNMTEHAAGATAREALALLPEVPQ